MMDPLAAQLAGEVRRLAARLAALEAMRPSGTGVSTAFGATSVRPMQTGFAVELTSGYDSSLGYSWKRLDLVPPAFVSPDVQLAGNLAFTIDDDQTLTATTKGWLNVSDTAGGWIFTPVKAGGLQTLEVVTGVECVDDEIVVTTATITGYFTVEE